MRSLGLLASLFVLALPRWAAAQDNVSADLQSEAATLKERVETFFSQLIGPPADAEHAVRAIIGDGPLQSRTDEVKKLIDQAQSLDARAGLHKGHDLAGSRNIGSDLVFLRYLYKGERYPVVWYFAFYRTNSTGGLKGEWKLISLRFDTKVESLDR